MKAKAFLAKHGLLFALSVCLLLSAVLNIVQYAMCHREEPGIVGTYCTGDGMSDADEYLTFDKSNHYAFYRQFHMIEQGEYIADANGIYTLRSADGEGTTQILLVEDAVYRFADDGRITIYKRIADLPVFINVN